MTNKEEFDMWTKVLQQLESVPNSYRSQNHTNYLNEIKMRISDCLDLDKYVSTESKI
jgi:phenylalanine-4-hydroxylase